MLARAGATAAAVAVSLGQDEGQECYVVTTPSAVYRLQTAAGALSSLEDRDGHDWIGFSKASSTDAYRGIPNLSSSAFHPGLSGHRSEIVVEEDHRAVIRCTKKAEGWVLEYEFRPTHAVLRVVSYDRNYWFLYEGTPLGRMEEDSDYWIRPAPLRRRTCASSFTEDLPAPEWMAFGDPNQPRVLFLAQHDDDAITDHFSSPGHMTIFGFGRQDYKGGLLSGPRTFSFGFLETDDPAVVQNEVEALLPGSPTDPRRTDRDGDWVNDAFDPAPADATRPFANPLHLRMWREEADLVFELAVAPGVTSAVTHSDDLNTWSPWLLAAPVGQPHLATVRWPLAEIAALGSSRFFRAGKLVSGAPSPTAPDLPP